MRTVTKCHTCGLGLGGIGDIIATLTVDASPLTNYLSYNQLPTGFIRPGRRSAVPVYFVPP